MTEFHQAFAEQIHTVFAGNLLGDDIFVSTSNQYFDADAAASELSYENWQDVPLATLVKHRNYTAYFTASAFHFYLPAMLTAIVLHTDKVDTLFDNVIHDLMPPMLGQTYRIFQERTKKFSEEESAIIGTFFEEFPTLFPPSLWTQLKDSERSRAIEYWISKSEGK